MKISKIAVVGAGTMGRGIAQQCAQSGLEVILVDASEVAVDRGMLAISNNLERQVLRSKLDFAEQNAVLARITSTTDYSKISGCQLIIEAVTEDLGLKQQILSRLEDCALENEVIATNTSSLSVTELAAALRVPHRLIGLHFFNPVTAMPLVEVARGLQTSEDAYIAALALSERIGKTAIGVRNSPGFVVNRLLCPMINEAIVVLQEGLTTVEEIDLAMKLGCSHPIGPLALADLIGLDTLLSIMEVLAKNFGDQKYRPALLLREKVAAGQFGRKSGQGFYTYSKDN